MFSLLILFIYWFTSISLIISEMVIFQNASVGFLCQDFATNTNRNGSRLRHYTYHVEAHQAFSLFRGDFTKDVITFQACLTQFMNFCLIWFVVRSNTFLQSAFIRGSRARPAILPRATCLSLLAAGQSVMPAGFAYALTFVTLHSGSYSCFSAVWCFAPPHLPICDVSNFSICWLNELWRYLSRICSEILVFFYPIVPSLTPILVSGIFGLSVLENHEVHAWT